MSNRPQSLKNTCALRFVTSKRNTAKKIYKQAQAQVNKRTARLNQLKHTNLMEICENSGSHDRSLRLRKLFVLDSAISQNVDVARPTTSFVEHRGLIVVFTIMSFIYTTTLSKSI